MVMRTGFVRKVCLKYEAFDHPQRGKLIFVCELIGDLTIDLARGLGLLKIPRFNSLTMSHGYLDWGVGTTIDRCITEQFSIDGKMTFTG